jgi:predicted dehydrogenase
MSKVKVAIIGYGHLGKWHVDKALALQDQCELIGIIELNESTRATLQNQFPHLKIVSKLKDIVDLIDAGIVVTPTSTHFSVVEQLLQAKKHVFCEKPLCSSVREALELKKLSLDQKTVLQVGHSERFHQIWETYRPIFMNLPGPYVVRINRAAAFKGRATDVDVLQDLMIHDLDLMLWLFSDKPNSVIAQGAKIRTKYWDQVSAHFTNEKGCHFYVTVGRNYTREVRDLEVYGSFGTYHVDLFSNQLDFATPEVFSDGSYVKTEKYPKRDHLLLEQTAFYHSILNQAPIVVDVQDGLNALRYIEAVTDSLNSQRSINIAPL